MDPISGAGATSMIMGLLGTGMDLAKDAMDMANKAMDTAGDGAKIGGEEQQPQGPISF
ncbi:hypothetical protein [Pseudomonas fluorescens]|uniref:hypothetical protein n=1 Tax=Pseudomonas fluorescens TaxID=294 RepID=UPI0012DB6F79|nr:hypothetical protein [Pseudomonas fluorescens]